MPSDNVPLSPTLLTHDFMVYPYPETGRILAYLETLSGIREETKGCITNLLNYRAVRSRARLPRGRSAAVLVPLFVGRSGDLYALLSRRSDALRAFAGDTALPGGKVDAQDVTVEDTARREAFEEIGLPLDKERVPLLCVMEPHLVKGETLVVPVVVLITDRGLQPNLNSSEVTSIFSQPLVSFLSSTPHLSSDRVADPNNPYHTFTDLPWNDGGAVRLHRFLTGREAEGIKPVFGLTASILIKTASIGYGRTPEFEVQPPNAPTPAQQIAHALLTPSNPLRVACEQEGIDANEAAAELLRPPIEPSSGGTIERQEIGVVRKQLTDGDDATNVSTGGVRNQATGSGSSSSPTSVGGNSFWKGVHERVEDQNYKEDGKGTEGLGVRTEEYGKQERERKERGGHCIPDMTQLGEYLDQPQDMVNDQMGKLGGNENLKLAEARSACPKIAGKVKKRLEAARSEDGMGRDQGAERREEGLQKDSEALHRKCDAKL